MLKPNFKLNVENKDGNSAEIHLEPLEKGFGHTLGNALRRVLLTNLEGAAPSMIKIDGVNHQFTTLNGLQENIIHLILGLKGVYFQMEGDGPETVKIDVKGQKTITGKDIDCPAGVKVANPDHVIGNLTDSKGKFKATITIEKGIGYVTSDEREASEVGAIPVDSIFTPVVKVNYTVEATRVGRRTDLDKVILQVTTNGTITPEDAVKKAAMILSNYFTQVYNPTFDESAVEEESISQLIQDEHMVEELELTTRVTNALKKGGYKKLSDFEGATEEDIMKVKNLGEKSVQDIINRLADKGIDVK